jgi:hypothetical protein
LCLAAKRKLNKAVRSPPMCRGPVGLGANLTRTLLDMVLILLPKIVNGADAQGDFLHFIRN